jgi:hypothetical protein
MIIKLLETTAKLRSRRMSLNDIRVSLARKMTSFILA